MKKSKAGVPLGKPRGWKRGDGPYTLYRQRLEVIAEGRSEEKVEEKVEEVVADADNGTGGAGSGTGNGGGVVASGAVGDGMVGPISDVVYEGLKFEEKGGLWEKKRMDSNHTMYASFDGMDQFYTNRSKRTGRHVVIKMKDGSSLRVLDIIPAKVESVRIAWPERLIGREWQEKFRNMQ